MNKKALILGALVILAVSLAITVFSITKNKGNTVGVYLTFNEPAAGVEFFLEYPTDNKFEAINIIYEKENLFTTTKEMDKGCWISIIALENIFEGSIKICDVVFESKIEAQSVIMSQLTAYKNDLCNTGEESIKSIPVDGEIKK